MSNVTYGLGKILCRMIYYGLFRLSVHGRDHIPEQGPIILCSNHISNLDPPLVGLPLTRRVHFMAKEELFKVPVLGYLIRAVGAFPVKRGGVSKESIKTALTLLKQGKVLGIFPEGTRRSQDGAAKRGAAVLALRAHAQVVPVAIVGRYKVFSKLAIYYGEPLDLSDCKDEEGNPSPDLATEKIMQAIQALLDAHGKQS
ncbi:1-acyl-sn-glycerol-3-phosphate acyltransferase [Xylanibacillus composti]|uniref:1-acyl-sn-glycerol-3-phosphate acyltransferase n=1 Tax=Xylanibacillus composti TaxID=1572762 RepID=A0A8J4M4E3_9BACL|nr:lysophospholipid acyltransferase family protein [Xylanibacillus composti]MDT9725439.1 1-acyl-sn-glycerol-3-phosphate acyltransferase [Xylanibacillus composti]GIQ71045.1 1-acyl-sn-glycerol-3-phosphate acyltransferase [Xylanibacillus composti]